MFSVGEEGEGEGLKFNILKGGTMIEFVLPDIMYLLKKRNKGKRRSNLFNDIGIYSTKELAEKEVESLGDVMDNYKVIPFPLNKSRYHFN